jgi:hypothetical protein
MYGQVCSMHCSWEYIKARNVRQYEVQSKADLNSV